MNLPQPPPPRKKSAVKSRSRRNSKDTQKKGVKIDEESGRLGALAENNNGSSSIPGPTDGSISARSIIVSQPGVIISRVSRRGPSLMATLTRGDIVTSVNDKAVSSPDDIRAILDSKDVLVGDFLKFEVLRDSDKRKEIIQVEIFPDSMLFSPSEIRKIREIVGLSGVESLVSGNLAESVWTPDYAE